MRDQISIPRVAALHPKYRTDFQHFLEDGENAFNIRLRLASGWRSFAEQETDYQKGRTTPGPIVTYSPPGSSYHNYGLAGDVVKVNPDGSIDWKFDYSRLVPIALKYGMTCGYNFPHKDSDHFENKFGYNWRTLLHKYQAKDFIPGTQYVNI